MSLTERLALIVDMDAKGAIKGLTSIGETAEKQLSKAETGGAKFGKTMSHVGVGMIGVGAVIGGALFEMSEKAGQAELAAIKLDNSVANSGKVAKGSAPEFEELAKSIQSKTAASRIDIMAGEAQLIQMGADAEQVKTLTPLIVDLARKKGVDLVTANTAVGKALNGTSGGLAKMGVVIDKTAFQTDHFSAIVTALRNSVGGFAEEEGKTFEGSVQRLKNQLGDLEAGIGKGAVDAFTNFLKPVSALSDAFTGLSPATQGTIGEFGTYGAAGLIAAGTTAALVGKLISAKENFVALETEMPKVSAALKTLGVAGGVLAVAFGLYEAVQFADSLNKTTVDTDKFTAAIDSSDKAVRQSAFDAVELASKTGKLTDAIVQAAKQSTVGAQVMIDAAVAAGVNRKEIEKLRGIVQDKELADWAAANALGAHTTAALTAANAEKILAPEVASAGDAASSAAEDFVKLNDITGKNIDPVKELTNALGSLIDKFIGGEKAQDSFQHDLNGLVKGVTDARKAGLRMGAALISTSDAAITFRGSMEQVVNDGAATIDYMIKQGASTDQVTTKVGQLSKQFEDQARAAGVPQAVINHYVEILNTIPTLIGTEVTADTSQASAALAGLQAQVYALEHSPFFTHPAVPAGPAQGAAQAYINRFNSGSGGGLPGRAIGGPVEAGKAYLVGENGPEPFIPSTNGYIMPNHQLRAASSKMSTAPAGAPIINVYIQADTLTDGHKLAAAVMPAVRKAIGTTHGGDVQAALGGRR